MMIEQVTQQPMATWQRLFYAGPSADALHEDYAKRGRIDDLAPIADPLRNRRRRARRTSLGAAQPT